MLRMPAVAGKFYPADAEELTAQIRACFEDSVYGPGSLPTVDSSGPKKICGLIVPHAGYVYSGFAAAKAYHRLAADRRPDAVILIGPNHYANGKPLAVYSFGAWQTPLGEVEVEETVAAHLVDACESLENDVLAHTCEHSIEVQLPFLQYLYGEDLKIVPVSVGAVDPTATEELGAALAEALQTRNVVVIASSDLSHYLPQEVAVAKDQAAIGAMLTLDPSQLREVVSSQSVSMCGVAPVASLLSAARAIPGIQGRLLGYNTSGDVTGDKRQVVGYASIEFGREA